MSLLEVSFQIDADDLSEAIIEVSNMISGMSDDVQEVVRPLLEALDSACRFEVEEGCEES